MSSAPHPKCHIAEVNSQGGGVLTLVNSIHGIFCAPHMLSSNPAKRPFSAVKLAGVKVYCRSRVGSIQMQMMKMRCGDRRRRSRLLGFGLLERSRREVETAQQNHYA